MPVAAPAPTPVWVTLGTAGDPVVNTQRSQPANAMMWRDHARLADCGDGALEQLAKVGMQPRSVRVMFLSHLHFDHTGGVAALLGLRYAVGAPGALTVYGPPGTSAMIAGLVAAMWPAADAGYGLPSAPAADPAAGVTVHELTPRETVTIDGVRVRAAQNTHYRFLAGGEADRRLKSFAYRFDLGGAGGHLHRRHWSQRCGGSARPRCRSVGRRDDRRRGKPGGCPCDHARPIRDAG